MKHVIPRFENTRRVKIQDLPGGEYVLVCDCKIFTKYGHGCRHVYRLLKRRPLITDARVRWYNGYALHYGINKELSDHYLYLRDSFEIPGVPISKAEFDDIDQSMQIGEGDAPREYFMSSLDKLKLRGCSSSGKGIYWQKVARSFPDIDPLCFECDASLEQSDDTEAASSLFTPEGATDADNNKKQAGVSVLGSGPFGCSQMIQKSSTYIVPSQQASDVVGQLKSPPEEPPSANIDAGSDSDDESDGSDDWATDVFDPSTADPYNNFMHMYQHCTKYAKAHGKAGQDILNAGFRKIRKELSALGGDKPLIKHARGHKRKTKPGSPGRSTRKKRPHK